MVFIELHTQVHQLHENAFSAILKSISILNFKILKSISNIPLCRPISVTCFDFKKNNILKFKKKTIMLKCVYVHTFGLSLSLSDEIKSETKYRQKFEFLNCWANIMNMMRNDDFDTFEFLFIKIWITFFFVLEHFEWLSFYLGQYLRGIFWYIFGAFKI